MSETGHAYPEFNTPDIQQNAFEDNAPVATNPVIALDATVMFISPEFVNRLESETRHAQRRHDMLMRASSYYGDSHYASAISELREIVRDLTIAGDTSHLPAIEAVIEHCWQCMSRKVAPPAMQSVINKIAS